MPFKWERGRNPYVFNFFGMLQLGSNARPDEITSQAKERIKVIKNSTRGKVELAGVELDEHAITAASAALRSAKTLAEELLLVQPQTRQERGKLKKLAADIEREAALPKQPDQFPLHHPLAIFWLLPEPGIEVAPAPQWEEFKLVKGGDPEDRDLDVVFDG